MHFFVPYIAGITYRNLHALIQQLAPQPETLSLLSIPQYLACEGPIGGGGREMLE